jgi:uncharacterized protein
VTVLTWAGTDQWRAESAEVRRTADGFTTRGVQLGIDPLPYRLDYDLDTAGGWVTRTLAVTAAGDGWQRTLHLARDVHGRWACEATARGEVSLPAPGGNPATLAGALDCDLGLSPLTNTMPILRSGLHREAGVAEFTMAWVSVPDLGVHASVQRYEHLRTMPAGAVVRYRDGDFTADVIVDADGFVLEYPALAGRVGR